MASTTYTDYQTPAIKAAWLNDVNAVVYDALGNNQTAKSILTFLHAVQTSDNSITDVQIGTLANRPTAGTQGRVYITTDSPIMLYIDSGTTWSPLDFTDASNLTVGVLPAGRLTGTYNISISGSAVNLNGNPAAFYRNASNLNAGTVPSARLTGSYGIDISGNAATVTGDTSHSITLADATNATQAVSLGQADSRFSLSGSDGSGLLWVNYTSNTTLTGAESGKHVGTQGAITLTLPTSPITGYNFTIWGNNNPVVVKVTNTTGYPDIGLPDSSSVHSHTIYATYQAGIFVFFDGTNWRAWTFGRPIILDAVNDNEAVSLGQATSLFSKAWTITTAALTASPGDKILADSSGGVFTITLPASPSPTDAITVRGVGGSVKANNVTIASNGQPIAGTVQDFIIDQENFQVDFVYNNSTRGWEY